MKNYFEGKAVATNILLSFFIVLAIIVKFFQIGYRSLSLDELYSVCAALEPDYRTFLKNWVLYDSNPPLYYFFLRIWLKVFPASELLVRLPSALFILLASILFINGIKKRFKGDAWFYLLILVGTCYGFLFFGQEARGYALLLLFTCLQLLYFIDLIRIDPTKKSRIVYIFLTIYTILSSYTHYSGIVFSAFLYITLLAFHYRNIVIMKQLLLSIVIIIGVGLLWSQYFHVILQIDKSFVTVQNYTIVKDILMMLFFGNSLIGKCATVLAIVIFPVIIYSLSKMMLKKEKPVKIIIILGAFSGMLILASPIIPYFFSYRHYIVLLPIIFLSLALLFSTFSLTETLKTSLLTISVIIVVSQGLTHYKSLREEWRQAVNYIVQSNKGENAKVIIIGEPWEKLHFHYLQIDPGGLNLAIRRKSFYDYYFKRLDTKRVLQLIVLRPSPTIVKNYINSELRRNGKIFLLDHAGIFSPQMAKIKFGKNISVEKKKLYMHTAYYIAIRNNF